MTILLCDDEVLTTRALSQSIDWNACGVDRVLVSNSVPEAKGIMEAQRVDLLLCDIEMPGESGMELLGWVRENQPWVICSMLTCHADFEYAQNALRLQSYDYLLKPIDEGSLLAAVERMVNVARGKKETDRIESIGRQWLDSRSEKARKNEAKPDTNQVVAQVNAYILEHISEEISVEGLAKLVFISPDHLSRIYKKKTGMSLNQYIIEQRMSLAAHLLSRGVSATNTAMQVGYSSYSSFVNMFKRVYGVAPASYGGDTKN